MEEIKQIISKVREMYRFDITVKDIITSPVSVRVEEKEGELQVAGIIFNYLSQDDNITVLPNCIRYYNRKKNNWKTLVTYKNFKELLKM